LFSLVLLMGITPLFSAQAIHPISPAMWRLSGSIGIMRFGVTSTACPASLLGHGYFCLLAILVEFEGSARRYGSENPCRFGLPSAATTGAMAAISFTWVCDVSFGDRRRYALSKKLRDSQPATLG
jgi:hypothetical protein